MNKFSSRIGFIAAASGAAIGLGNIWKFPYEVGANGGAAFLVLYLLFTIFLGYPIVLAKIAFGRSNNKGLYHIYKHEGIWQIQGLLPAIMCLILFSFYSIVTGWILGYIYNSVNGLLFKQENFTFFFNNLVKGGQKNIILTFIVMLIVFVIVKSGIEKGIELSSKILMPIFIFLIIGLIVYGFFLENSFEGIKFYLLPKFSLLTKKSVITALSHSFFSLTIGASVMIVYGSYLDSRSNLINDAGLVVLSDLTVAFLAGLLVFPYIFYQGVEPNEGPSLIFITLPQVFKKLNNFTGNIVCLSFFILLFFAAITSAISMIEIPINYIMDRWNFSRAKSVTIALIFAYCLSIPSILSKQPSSVFSKLFLYNKKYISLMEFIGKLVDYGLILSGFLFCIFIGKKWKKYKISEQLYTSKSNPKWLINYTYFCIRFIAPIFIAIIFLFSI